MAVDAPLRDKRTRLTNHRDVLPHTDGRTSLAKRYKAIVTAIARDQGGAEQLSEISRPTGQAIRRRFLPRRIIGGTPGARPGDRPR